MPQITTEGNKDGTVIEAIRMDGTDISLLNHLYKLFNRVIAN